MAHLSGRKLFFYICLCSFLTVMFNYIAFLRIPKLRNKYYQNDKTRIALDERESNAFKTEGRSKSDMSFPPVNKFITASTWLGRLGNQLFIYAAILGTSYKFGYAPYIRPNDPKELLKYIDVKYTGGADLKNLKIFSEAGCCAYDPKIENLSDKVNISLSGHFQSWKYFAGAENFVRENIKLRQSFVAAAKEFLQNANSTMTVFVGVHVRRGDKTSELESKKGNSIAGTDYIFKAMNYFQQVLGPSTTFIVVSDDKTWCLENLSGNNTVHSPFDDPGVDLAILSLCDHVIVTSGTYGWWGAWLAGGRTVFYNRFPRKQSWLASIMVKDDYYPLHWIGMS